MNIKNCYDWGVEQLKNAPTQTPELDTRRLLLAVFSPYGFSKIDLFIDLQKTENIKKTEKIFTKKNISIFKNYIQRRIKGEPIALILGDQGFWSLDLIVSPDTLVPRPETELLVEIILEKSEKTPQHCLDLGTGSGAIALSVAKERPNWTILASDQSFKALEIAQKNADLNNINNIIFKQGSWFEALPPGVQFSIIVSNPPYIAEHDPHLDALSFEPYTALVSGKTGLEDIESIIKNAPDFLLKDGLLILEHGYDQKITVQKLFKKYGFSNIESRVDLAGVDRATFGFWI